MKALARILESDGDRKVFKENINEAQREYARLLLFKVSAIIREELQRRNTTGGDLQEVAGDAPETRRIDLMEVAEGAHLELVPRPLQESDDALDEDEEDGDPSLGRLVTSGKTIQEGDDDE